MTVTAADLPDSGMANLLLVADMARKGLWWESGGLGDQSQWLIQAVRTVWHEERQQQEQRR